MTPPPTTGCAFCLDVQGPVLPWQFGASKWPGHWGFPSWPAGDVTVCVDCSELILAMDVHTLAHRYLEARLGPPHGATPKQELTLVAEYATVVQTARRAGLAALERQPWAGRETLPSRPRRAVPIGPGAAPPPRPGEPADRLAQGRLGPAGGISPLPRLPARPRRAAPPPVCFAAVIGAIVREALYQTLLAAGQLPDSPARRAYMGRLPWGEIQRIHRQIARRPSAAKDKLPWSTLFRHRRRPARP